MKKFTSNLIVESYSDTKWKLTEAFFFYFDEKNKKYGITVPKGFITDFASVPRFLWNILPPTGRYTKATVFHDFLYSTAPLPRKRCDQLFLQGMTILGVKPWKRKSFYIAVRIFGRKHFKNK